MLRPFFPELVMSTDLLSFEHPSVLLFCFQILENEFQIFENEFQILQNTDFCTHWLAIERRFKGKVNQQIHTIS